VVPTELKRVAIYDRTIGASVARIWENVLDWEHLPWLHRTSFAAIRSVEASSAGWRGWLETRSRQPSESLVDVSLDRPALRYLTRTAEGDGAGTEIWTKLEPVSARATRIHVEFSLPGVAADRADEVGAAYVRVYARLWDEDEAMMVRRQTVVDDRAAGAAQASLPLGPLAALRARLPLTLRIAGREVRLVDSGGDVLAHPTRCPHFGGPLADASVEHGAITCPWHGYRYDVRSGRCTSGHPAAFGRMPRVDHDPATGEATLQW